MKSRFILFFLSLLFTSTFALSQSTDNPSGSGTSGDPYLISNLNELYTVTQNSHLWDKYYKQTFNIDASSTSGWDGGDGFTTIGNTTTKFTGEYDGNNKTITGLTIDRSSTLFIGMFGVIEGATLTKINLVDVDITGSNFTGGLAGDLLGSDNAVSYSSISGDVAGQTGVGGLIGRSQSSSNTITGNSSSASVSGFEDVGGFIGLSYNTELSLNNATGAVSGTNDIGGFVGELQYGTLSTNYANGAVNGTTNVGGFVGYFHGGTLENSYATGNASGTTSVGGLVGEMENNTFGNAVLTDNYSTGSATGSTNIGGLLGNKVSGTITTNYWNTTTSGLISGVGTGSTTGTSGLTTDEMRRTSSFTSFDFTNDWEQIDGIHYPSLQDNVQSLLPGIIEFDGGAGSSGSPYQISTAAQLYLTHLNLSSYFVLTQDIDLSTETSSGGIFWNDGEGFEPIGTGSGSFSFTGHLDGAGYSVDGLYINRPSESEVGFFSGLNGISSGSVTSLALTNVDITGGEDTGALSGVVFNGAAVSENYVTGSVTSTSNYTGGMIGGFFNGTMTDNYSLVNVSGSEYAGGLIGRYTGGTVTENYSIGTVTGTSNLGGFIGIVSGSSASNNYWFISQSEQLNGVGSGSSTGITGLTSAKMRTVSSFTGFDFVNDWQNNAPNAYPSLQNVSQNPLPGYKLYLSNGSASLDGVNDWVDLPDSIAIALGNGSDMTMEAWVKPDYDNQADRGAGAIFSINSSSGANVLQLYVSTLLANYGQIRVFDGGDSAYEIGVPQVANDVWVHVAYTLEGTTGTYYLDGVLMGTHDQSTPLSIADQWSFGQEYDGSTTSNFSKTLVDEIRIWDRARTQDEIQLDMFQMLNGDEDGLTTYIPFDVITGTNALDQSSNGFNLSLEGGATSDSDTHPYGTFITGNEGWRMMTAPVSGVTYGELLDTLWTQGFTGADVTNGISNVYAWSESTRSFSSISNATDIPADGSGFLMYVYDDDDYDETADGFPKIIKTDSTQRTSAISPTLSFTSSDTLANDGWNLVGNPYGATIDWDASSGLTSTNLDASFYVWSDSANSGAGDYLTWNGTTGTFGGGEIAPWQGFWVKANAASPSITLSDEVRKGGGILRKQVPVSQLGFTMKGETLSSKTILMFSDNVSVEKDRLDAYKLQSLNEEYLSLFTQLDDGSGLDINALPLDLEETLSIPLGVDLGSDTGSENSEQSAPTSFELIWNPKNLPEGMDIVLFDSETGTEINLTEASSYRFEIESQAKIKIVKTQNPVETQNLASVQDGIRVPSHKAFSPKVMKAKAADSRFTILINASTSVSNEPNSELPSVVELDQNYPNPFNPSTTINFAVPEQANVQLVIFDMLGRKVAELLNEPKSAGRYSINFNASQLASGLYLYRLQVGSSVLTKKMTLIK